MAEFIINKDYEDQIKKLINEISLNGIGKCIKSKKYIHLYDYLTVKYPFLCGSVTEYIYWLINDLKEFPKCKVCGKELRSFLNVKNGYIKYCRGKCSQNNPETIEKKKQTFLLNYGVDNPTKNEIIKQKIKDTLVERYGVENAFQSQNFKEKFKRTCIERYGVEYPAQSKEIHQKTIDSCKSHYGVEFPSQSRIIQERQKKTILENYGVEFPLQNKKIYDKQKQTCLKRYGVEYPTVKYIYKTLRFDSAPELAYYIWLTDNNVKFEFHPDKYFSYVQDEIQHRYYPDFYLIENNQFIEIKGGHFFCKGPEIMINPYSGKSEYSKYQCMIENKIKIIRDDSDEMKMYRKYIDEKYGTDYLASFRISKHKQKEHISNV